MRKIIETIENTTLHINDWIVSFVCILFVRFLLESISSPAPSGMMPTDMYTLIHYGLFFLSVALGLICIMGMFTKDYGRSSKFVLFIFPIMWVAPIFDLILNRTGEAMSYIYATPKELLIEFFKFPFFTPVSGITVGMHIQIILLFWVVGYYIWMKTKKYKLVIGTLLSFYIFMFFLGAIPSMLYAIQHTHVNENSIEITNYLESTILNSNIIHNSMHEGALTVSRYRFFQIGFDKLMSQILFVISLILIVIFFWKKEKVKTREILKNSRPIRILYYLTPLLIATGYSLQTKKGYIYSWVDMLSYTCLLVSWFGMWMYSVHLNDVYDTKIDTISNSNRPIINGSVTKEDMIGSSNVFLWIALIGSWCAGFYSFFFVMVGLTVAYIYSTPPLRLRRFIPLSSFLISIVILCAVLSGFFFVSIDKKIQSFPTIISLGILLFYTFQINFKDIKDIEGDQKEGISTVPLVFKKQGIKITGALFSLSFLLAPIFLNNYLLYIVSLPVSIAGYMLINKKPYVEKSLFYVHFTFLVLLIIIFEITF